MTDQIHSPKGDRYLAAMIYAAQAAGDVLMSYFAEDCSIAQNETLKVENKKPSDFVTQADLQSETVIFDILEKAWPGFSFLLEEAGVKRGQDDRFRWIVDPLDGTTNFVKHIPHFSVSIALTFEGRPIAGVVFNPCLNELFTASAGGGATLNGRCVNVAVHSPVRKMVFGTGLPFADKTGHEDFVNELVAPMKNLAGIRRLGSAALDLCYVACGRFDAFWEHHLSAWDVAAGVLIVREAGGKVTRLNGMADAIPTEDILAASGASYARAKKIIVERELFGDDG